MGEKGCRTKKEAKRWGRLLAGLSKNFEKDLFLISFPSSLFFLIGMREGSLNIFSEAIGNLILHQWVGDLAASLSLSQLWIWKPITEFSLLLHFIPGLYFKFWILESSTNPCQSCLLPFSCSYLSFDLCPKSLSKSAYSSFGSIWLSHCDLNCFFSKIQIFWFSVPILDEKLGFKTSTSVCGSFKSIKYNGTV